MVRLQSFFERRTLRGVGRQEVRSRPANEKERLHLGDACVLTISNGTDDELMDMFCM